jgi:hypothetical protein
MKQQTGLKEDESSASARRRALPRAVDWVRQREIVNPELREVAGFRLTKLWEILDVVPHPDENVERRGAAGLAIVDGSKSAVLVPVALLIAQDARRARVRLRDWCRQ